MKEGDARMRRLRVRAGVVIVLLAVAATGLITWYANSLFPALTTAGPTISGQFLLNSEPGHGTHAEDVWQAAGLAGKVPWEEVAIAKVTWRAEPGNSDVSRCKQVLVALHPTDWLMSAVSDSSLAMGSMASYIRELAQLHPEILDVGQESARPLAGTMFMRDLPDGTLEYSVDLLWNVPNAVQELSTIRVGIAVFCDDSLNAFSWLARR